MKKLHAAIFILLAGLSTHAVAQRTDQTITFNTIPAKTYGNPEFALVATASSGLAVSFSTSNPQIIFISGTTATILRAGEVVITATQGGSGVFNPAPPVAQRMFVQKAAQTITFPAIPLKTYGDPDFIPASVLSFLPITFTSSDPAVASVVSGRVVINRAGEVQITATQLGNAKFHPAISVTRTLTIQKAAQTVTFTNLVDKIYGDPPFTISATASSGLTVDWIRSDYDTVAEVNGNVVTPHSAGGTPIWAYQKGNENYLPVLKGKYFVVHKAFQTITFDPIPAKTFGDEPFTVNATASSGLPITYTSNRKTVATVSGNVVVIHSAGEATIWATQAGDANYQGLMSYRSFTVSGLGQTYSLTGSARLGGFGGGTIFSINSDGTGMNVTERFEPTSLARPNGGLLKASDGKLYGVLSLASVMGHGEIFSMNADGSDYMVLRSLQPGEGNLATGSLIEGTDGYLYGVTTNPIGLIYRLKKNSSDFTIVYTFQSVYFPTAGVMQATDNRLYGTAPIGGDFGTGALYGVNTDGTNYSNIFSFDGLATGSTPRGVLHQGADQYLYGGTAAGGANDKGIIYKVKTDGTDFTTLVTLDSTNGWAVSSSLILASDGKLYGMTERGGAYDKGVIFSLFPNGTGFVKLLDFDGVNKGAAPLGSLIESATDGYLYGMTSQGGTADLGVSFKVNKNGSGFTKLVDFTGPNGSSPLYGPMLEVNPGLFYGMTHQGGNGDVGLIYSVTSGGTYALVKDYPQPISKPETLTGQDSDDHFVGISTTGGTTGAGTLFTVAKDGTNFTTLADLPPGSYPRAKELLVATDHSIWGIGRDIANDFLFRMTGDGTSYQRIDMSNALVGLEPVALVESNDGYIYGAARRGGAIDAGTIFRIRLDGTGLSHVVDFPGNLDTQPTAELIMHSNGSLYGLTEYYPESGTLYRIKPDHTYTRLAIVGAELLKELNGGTLCLVGPSSLGMFDADGEPIEGILSLFPNVGQQVQSMVQTVDGYLILAMREGGTTGYGTLIKVLPDGSQYFKIKDFEAPEGARPNSLLMVRGEQQITSFDDIPEKKFLDSPFALRATTSSGAPVHFTSTNPSVAEVDGYVVTIKGVGTTTIHGRILANGNFTESAELTKTLTVVESDQQFTFDAIPAKRYGDPDFTLVAGSASGLPISFTSSDEQVATVTNRRVTIVGVGTTTITASIVQNSNFHPAPPIQRVLTVSKADQVIQFDPIGAHYVDAAPYSLSFANSSGLPVTFLGNAPTIATVIGTTVTPVAAGGITITADAAGDANYNAAATAQRPALLIKHDQTLVFDAIPDQPIENASFEYFPPLSSFGIPVVLTTTATNVSILGSVITMNTAGKVTLTASHPGTNVVNAATSVSQTFCVIPSKPNITVDTSNPDQPVLTSSAATGNEWLRNSVVIAGSTGQTFMPAQSGNYTVRVNADGCVSPASAAQAIVVVGLEEATMKLAVFPNPATGTLYASLPPTAGEVVATLEVHNLLGAKLIQVTTTQSTAALDIQTLPPGLYLLKVTREEKTSMVRFVIR